MSLEPSECKYLGLHWRRLLQDRRKAVVGDVRLRRGAALLKAEGSAALLRSMDYE